MNPTEPQEHSTWTRPAPKRCRNCGAIIQRATDLCVDCESPASFLKLALLILLPVVVLAGLWTFSIWATLLTTVLYISIAGGGSSLIILIPSFLAARSLARQQLKISKRGSPTPASVLLTLFYTVIFTAVIGFLQAFLLIVVLYGACYCLGPSNYH